MTITLNNKTIFAFADTHGRHQDLQYDYENTDILVCAGDVCEMGDENQLQDFFAWFAEQPVKHKLFVSGNHDLSFELFPEYAEHYIPEGVTHLNNNCIKLEGIWFFAPSVTMLNTLSVPIYVDVLVTHLPPSGILDDSGRWGSEYSLILTQELNPKVHIFGHYHQSGNKKVTIGNTTFYNVAKSNCE